MYRAFIKILTHVVFNSEELTALPLKSGTRQECPFSGLLFKTILKILARELRQKKKTKNQGNKRHTERKEIKLSLFGGKKKALGTKM